MGGGEFFEIFFDMSYIFLTPFKRVKYRMQHIQEPTLKYLLQ